MKHLLFLWLFVVTWNEYELKDDCPSSGVLYLMQLPPCDPVYTVEIATKTIRLATQRDVDLFVGYSKPEGTGVKAKWVSMEGLISDTAFNIQVREEGE